jgi:hypothetical protein
MMTEQSLAELKEVFDRMNNTLYMHDIGAITTDEAMLALDRFMFHAHDAWMPTRMGEVDLNTGLRMPTYEEQRSSQGSTHA